MDLFATGELWFPVLEHSRGIIFHSDQLEFKGVVSHRTHVLEPELRSSGSAESAVSHGAFFATSIPDLLNMGSGDVNQVLILARQALY